MLTEDDSCLLAEADTDAEELWTMVAEEDSCLLTDADADGDGDGLGVELTCTELKETGIGLALVSAKHFLSNVL